VHPDDSETVLDETPRHGRRLRAFAGYVAAAVCLVWVFRDMPFGAMWGNVQQLRWGSVALAVAVDILSYVAQGLRWRLLLRPVGSVTLLGATQAIYAGLFASEVLPMRPGELVRAYAVARRLRTDVAAVLPSIMVERLFDGVWLAAGVGLTAMLVPLPRDLLRAADVLGLVILLATALFMYVVLGRSSGQPMNVQVDQIAGHRRRPAMIAWLNELRDGARKIGHRRETYVAFGLSLTLLAGQILAFWLVTRAYKLEVGLWVAAATLIVVHLGTAIPNAPANVGTYQFFCVVGLMLFGIDKTVASGFSVVVFVVLTVPLWLLGSMALVRTGVSLNVLRKEHSAWKSEGR
jgi:glycosyltransferase 2 family protein